MKPENQIKLSAKYIYLVALDLNKEKHYSKKLDQKIIEKMLKKNLQYVGDGFIECKYH